MILRTIRKTEAVMALHTTAEQTRLLAGVIAYVSQYLDTGCSRAARRAGLLLRHLDASAMDQELMTSCEALDRAISRTRLPADADAAGLSSISTRPRLRSSQACAASVSFPN
jgi:hypothetical protein